MPNPHGIKSDEEVLESFWRIISDTHDFTHALYKLAEKQLATLERIAVALETREKPCQK